MTGALPAAHGTPRARTRQEQLKALEAFGPLLWHGGVVLGANQSVCIGDHFLEPGAPVEFGLIAGRFHDRIFFRTDRKTLREWILPAPGQPDSAIAWARAFVARFATGDTLFVEMHEAGDPVFATGQKAVRMAALFRRYLADDFTPSDWKDAADLGIPDERFVGPPLEKLCLLGWG